MSDRELIARLVSARHAAHRGSQDEPSTETEQRLTAQYEVARVLAESASLDQATTQVLRAVCEHLAWDFGALWRIDPDAGALRCIALWHRAGLRVPGFAMATRQSHFRRGVGFPGRIWALGRPKWLENVAADTFCPRAAIAADEGLHAALGFPILVEHEVIGVIEFFSREIRPPNRHVMCLVTTVGGQIGQFIVRKAVEEKRILSEARLQAILDNATAVIYLKDTQGRYLLINSQFESLFRITRQQIIGKTDYDVFPREVADAFRANDEKVLAIGAPIEFEEVAPHADGPHTYISIKFPLRDAAGVPCTLCGISTDITGRKRTEEQLKRACADLTLSEEALRNALTELKASHEELKSTQLRLIQAEKLESIGTLAAGVAHEVKNPLQTIQMGVDFLLHHPEGGTAEEKALVVGEMRDAVQRADSIIRSLLEFSAVNRAEVHAEPLNPIIRQSLALVKYELVKSHISLVQDLAEELPPLKLDKNKIEQVFINLFLNAIQAMPGGGTLFIRTRREPVPAGTATDSRSATTNDGPPASGVLVEIEDTGLGIPPEKLRKIFDPFFTTKPPGIGNGLGLAVTKKIVDLHGGRIEICNRDHVGVRVRIRFNI